MKRKTDCHDQRRVTPRGRGVTALCAAVILAAAATGCSGGSHSSAPVTSPASAGGRGVTTGSDASTSSSLPTTPSTTATTLPSVPTNLVADPVLKGGLLTAYAASKQRPVSIFSGPEPGTVYYAWLPSDGNYWAVATFSLTSAADFQDGVAMQDGGDMGVFTRHPGGSWKVVQPGVPFPCPSELPAALVSLWGMHFAGSCLVADGTSPARDRATVLVDSLPSGVYFGNVLVIQADLDGSGTMLFEPETWQSAGSTPVSHSGQYADLSISNSTTYGYWVGSDPAGAHQVLGHIDGQTGPMIVAAMPSFASDPHYGYEVTVTNSPGCTPGCSAVASMVQYGPLAPSPPSPDFTEPPVG